MGHGVGSQSGAQVGGCSWWSFGGEGFIGWSGWLVGRNYAIIMYIERERESRE